MEFEDDAFVLAARAHGETGAIVELLTSAHGRYAAHVAGGASRKVRPFLQPGARVIARYRARVSDQLGSAAIEPVGEGPAALFDDPLALSGLSAAAAVAAGALPEREPHPGAFLAFEALTGALTHPDVWPAVFVRFEAGLLQDLGFGLDLSKCAATGITDDLVWVSPRTGRAVSRQAGEPYKDRLLALPPFLLSAQGGLRAGDVAAGLALTGHFLEAFIFGPLNRPLPPARLWLLDRLSEAGRL
ncbi:recombinational DNA repair protein (RecF pathway) [Phenylobacterium zucineum HLK1]|uniref:DNA repair protein RecO n=1 Tax=Phenylobacterium zucineum (strain HLK1) TaxID=450851 RepID=RECO_PHEZH|nr:DNA repair protein RecO [Phenylobacterium zucineum]B4RCU1.1 RecName: Full=DNA repair protein RecO; AltName: Full=Recombination protein O [Phenylobacterium zucineum HLK1]ACG78278.1 recombinational DNA repair protein (RecF pathway) [Phenylobacterium zucineum HLK1]